jgi:dolichol-phosphate mannosyltransferase
VPVDLSIVVPVFNEADNVAPLAQEVAAAFRESRQTLELIFVDDGSTDRTWEEIAISRRRDPRVRGLRLHQNSGQSAALWTGLQVAMAPIIATLDGDRQNDPADLPTLLAALEQADLVVGVRTKRQDSAVRRWSASVARWARMAVLGVGFQDTGCNLRVFRRRVLADILPFNGFHRFLPVLAHASGTKVVEVPVHHRPRTAGASKYGVWNRLWRGLADLAAIAWYQQRRLRPVAFSELADHSGDAGAAAVTNNHHQSPEPTPPSMTLPLV